MIIQNYKFVDAHVFVETLNKAFENIVRIVTVSSPTEITTGWLITDILVVIPNYLGKSDNSFLCYPYNRNSIDTFPIKAKIVYAVPSSGVTDQPTLLQLEIPIKTDPLIMQLENSRINDQIIIPQYPQGNPFLNLSFGRIINVDAKWINYDADTTGGSSGSPILNVQTGKIVAMHISASREKNLNIGLSIGKILELLKSSDQWNDINRLHKITMLNNIKIESYSIQYKKEWKDIQIQAALSWNIDSTRLSKEQIDDLKPYIIDSSSQYWTMKIGDRRSILESQPLERLKNEKIKLAENEIGQNVINRILQGGPFNIEQIDVKELPYWLQAVRWFAGLDPSLPSSAEVNKVLERKKIRSQFSNLGGINFKGRASELKTLQQWYEHENTGPLMISGIGGMGKSALIGHFALSLPLETPIILLDFDRPDIAPDDAWSVLNILSEQIEIQTEGFVAPQKLDSWEIMATQMGEAFSKVLPVALTPLIILDGFEVAQHVKQYSEIWKLLELFIEECSRLKIIVSGRAKVSSLSLKKKDAVFLPLTELQPLDVEQLLEQHGITKKELVREITKIARGIPILLKLAVQYVETGGQLEKLPVSLPKKLIEGYLYQRILDRVIDVELKPICRKALVLRKLTANIITEILADSIPPNLSADHVFEGLSREMGLISENEQLYNSSMIISGQSNFLQLRPELRTAVIKLLEIEDPNMVTDIDSKAVKFYLNKIDDNFENRAELIYHLLRSGDLKNAKIYWQTECAPLLIYASDDLNDSLSTERIWLQEMIGQVISEKQDDIKIWELESFKQIKNLLERTHYTAVAEILKQREERSENSLLILYDAFSYWIDSNIPAAIELLNKSKPDNVNIAKNQYLFWAFLEVQLGNRTKADYLLSLIEKIDLTNPVEYKIESLALQAARIRLTVNLTREIELAKLIKDNDNYQEIEFLGLINARDVILPDLAEKLSGKLTLESWGSDFNLPVNKKDLDGFYNQIFKFAGNFGKQWITQDADNLESLFFKNNTLIDTFFETFRSTNKKRQSFQLPQIIELALLGDFRWKLATSKLILVDFANLASQEKDDLDPLKWSIIATLAAFRNQDMNVITEGYNEPSIDSFLKRVLRNNLRSISPPLSKSRLNILMDFINFTNLIDSDQKSTIELINILLHQNDNTSNNYYSLKTVAFLDDEIVISLFLYFYGPDPLEMLCRRVIGLPDNYKF